MRFRDLIQTKSSVDKRADILAEVENKMEAASNAAYEARSAPVGPVGNPFSLSTVLKTPSLPTNEALGAQFMVIALNLEDIAKDYKKSGGINWICGGEGARRGRNRYDGLKKGLMMVVEACYGRIRFMSGELWRLSPHFNQSRAFRGGFDLYSPLLGGDGPY